MRFQAFAKVYVRVTLNRASTINIRVREKLKNITVGMVLSNGDNFLFTQHMIFAAPRLADILFVPSQKRSTTNPKQMPWTDAINIWPES